jgi:hypothetical protein
MKPSSLNNLTKFTNAGITYDVRLLFKHVEFLTRNIAGARIIKIYFDTLPVRIAAYGQIESSNPRASLPEIVPICLTISEIVTFAHHAGKCVLQSLEPTSVAKPTVAKPTVINLEPVELLLSHGGNTIEKDSLK